MKPLAPLLAAMVIGATLPVHGQGALPDGPGKELIETACTRCHGVENITRGGDTHAGWENTVAMMRNAGAQVPAEQVQTVVDYLAKNFPERPAPPAVILPGNGVAVTITEWPVPTPGSRPHDPLAAPDGTIWYSAHMANLIGHVDPKTGRITEYHIPDPGSGPHGLVFGPDGDIYFTANFKAYIGKLDPHTAQFTEFKLDPSARDPHTPLFDRHGILWFTVQGADMVGRLDPASNVSKLVRVPTPRANPYGMVISSQGVPYFAEFGANNIGRIDPETMAITEYPLPNPDARPRRIAITPDDIIYYSDYARGYLGRFDPKTGAVEEWPSPGGPRSRPYGITYLKGAIWYSESATRPNTLVRFDLATHQFSSWPIPSGGGVVRNMMPTHDGGGIVMACSGVNNVALATIK